jgi:hypothetical protein
LSVVVAQKSPPRAVSPFACPPGALNHREHQRPSYRIVV